MKKNLKKTDVGMIPTDWDAVPLRRLITSLDAGVSVNSISDDSCAVRGDKRVLKTSCVVGGRFITGECKKVAPGDVKRAKLNPRKDSILISRMNTPTLVGECGYVDRDYDDLFLPDRLWMTGHRNTVPLNVRWLAHCLAFGAARQSIRDSATGTSGSMKNISKGALLSICIPAPSDVFEQEAISEVLSEADALIESLDQLLVKKRDLKQAAMQQLLTGQTRLPGFQGEWRVKRLGDYVRFLKNGVNSRAELVANGSTKYLHYGDIHAASGAALNPLTLSCLPEEKARSLDRLIDGDLVFADASEDIDGVGTSVEIVEASNTSLVAGLHTIAARFDPLILANGFKAYLQFCPPFRQHLRRLAAGTKVYATTRRHIAMVEIPLPSPAEQTAIAAVLSDIDAELCSLMACREKARAIKQGMMQELLTGRIRLV